MLQMLIQDDLTGLIKLAVVCQGHVVEEWWINVKVEKRNNVIITYG